MKRFGFVSVALVFLTLSAVLVPAQNPPGRRTLKEYENPPSIKPVDTVFMEDMTWLEIKNALKAGKTTAIVAAGGLEASGPFLTLNKHQNMLRGQTELIARKLGNALVAPVVKYTPADEGVGRADYLGDFFISVPTYKATLTDICTNLTNHGFQNIVLIGDHQGAQRGMKEVAEELRVRFIPHRVTCVAKGPSCTSRIAEQQIRYGVAGVFSGKAEIAIASTIVQPHRSVLVRISTEFDRVTSMGVRERRDDLIDGIDAIRRQPRFAKRVEAGRPNGRVAVI